MSDKRIRVGILGGSEADLEVLAELHKRPDIEIAFVYDRNPSAVAVEIAEILKLPALSEAALIGPHTPVEALVVADRSTFAKELLMHGVGAEILDREEALRRFAPAAAARSAEAGTATARDIPGGHPLDDALTGFERLFDRTRLLKLLLDLAVESTGASNGSIMMYSHDAGELYIAHATGLSERVIRNTRQKLGEGISGAVAQERKGKLIRQKSPYPRERDRAQITSACSVPLVDGDTLLGVLNVSSTEGGKELTVADLETLEKFSQRMARVLADSLRLAEARLRREEMTLRQSLGELTEQPGSTVEKFTLLSGMVARIVGAESVEVFVSTQAGEWLVLGGSSRRQAASPEFVRMGRGALARAYLERRAIVLTEPVDPQGGDIASSFAFIPLVLTDAIGVAVIEFSERHRLDDFLAVRDSVALELARFVGNERREARLRRELASLARVSDAAPALLGCRSLEDLAEVVARVIADALDCERVSLRLRGASNQAWTTTCHEGNERADDAWRADDAERFAKLEKKRAPYHLSLVDFSARPDAPYRPSKSVLAVPFMLGEEMMAGVIAYDRRAASAVEEAAFSTHDETVIEQVLAMAWPAARGLASGSPDAKPSYDEMLAGNTERLNRIVNAEMSRADRYHHPFSVLVIRAPAMADRFTADESHALALSDEIRRGIQTRTRKSDYGCWVRRDTYAMVTLEGSGRLHFLVSRLVAYLHKDLAQAGIEAADREVQIGTATYPGTARTADALLAEAKRALKPHPGA